MCDLLVDISDEIAQNSRILPIAIEKEEKIRYRKESDIVASLHRTVKFDYFNGFNSNGIDNQYWKMCRSFSPSVRLTMWISICDQFYVVQAEFAIRNKLFLNFNSYNKKGQTCSVFRRSPPELFLLKAVLKICCKFTGEHPCHFGMCVLLQICCIFSEYLFLRTSLEGCF